MVDGSSDFDAKLEARRAALGLTAQPFAKQAPRSTGDEQARLRDRAIFIAFSIMAVSVTVFQCIGLPITDDAVIPLAIPVSFISLAVLCWFVPPTINPWRLVLYFLFVATVGLSTSIFADTYSIASLALLVVLYTPFILSFQTTEANFRRCLDMFSVLMIALAGLEFLQHAMQLVAGPQSWPNPYKLLPEGMLVPNFTYLQPIAWGARLNKPQAFVFLEVSFLSQYIALALLIEILIFRRVKRIVYFSAALFATFAGTGLLLLLVSLPLVMGRMPLRNALLVTLVLLVVAGLAAHLGWIDMVGGRVTEFHKAGGSANHRFIEPFDRIMQSLDRTGSFYSGIGAGQIEKVNNHQFWPIAKAIVEYGLLPGLLFYAYFLYSMFDRPPHLRLAIVLVIWYTFEGALLTAVNPITCLLSSMILIERSRRGGERGGNTTAPPHKSTRNGENDG